MVQPLNNFTKPILFVLVFITLIVLFKELFAGFGIITGLVLSFVIFYYFGKNYDGILYVLSLFLVSLSIDLISPPYMVGLDGVVSNQALFSSASIDYFIGTIGQALGLAGIVLFYFTYVFAFGILFGLSIFVLKMTKNKGGSLNG